MTICLGGRYLIRPKSLGSVRGIFPASIPQANPGLNAIMHHTNILREESGDETLRGQVPNFAVNVVDDPVGETGDNDAEGDAEDGGREEWDEDDEEDVEDDTPFYTAEELGAIFLDFYKFLATLHYDLADLRIPPSGGWPDLPPDNLTGHKSEFAIKVLRHLPYFHSRASFHYKSRLMDFTSLGRKYFASEDWLERTRTLSSSLSKPEIESTAPRS